VAACEEALTARVDAEECAPINAIDGELTAVIASPVVQEAYLGMGPVRRHERSAHL
jgi:hypothetical protein